MAHDKVYGYCENKCLVEVCPKSELTSATIGTDWTDTNTQLISIPGVKIDSVVEIFLPSTATDEQVRAFYDLQLQDGGQADGSITLRCFGNKNAIAIPVNVIIRGDL